eukprot:CAMPEP_0198335768 /NCGR_PEP_ID=MMETSP1450-20131203/20538_1 /TAXON_ID=753684 ORGANISM="Madagascaria erythrocladiodes, Strain CCMP3234" /NCGR_SAMPLE_ID=MMETSP1450 /ASSEMBLY_ACC=CAM_ASM_001115 /LENGTH=100 /DNA_ID=CAMNT_0044040457 /DNA_START=54 /DNA_END=352 /DNA_ORIENTATION=-
MSTWNDVQDRLVGNNCNIGQGAQGDDYSARNLPVVKEWACVAPMGSSAKCSFTFCANNPETCALDGAGWTCGEVYLVEDDGSAQQGSTNNQFTNGGGFGG